MSAGLTVGGFRKEKFSNNIDRWSWFLSAFIGPSSIVHGRGFAERCRRLQAGAGGRLAAMA